MRVLHTNAFLLFVLVITLAACSSSKPYLQGHEKIVESTGSDRPDWLTHVPDDEDGKMFFRGFKTKAVTLEGGATDARENAARQVLEMIEQRGRADYSSVRVERGIPETDEDIGSIIEDGLKILAENVVRGVKEQESHFEKIEVFTGSGVKYYYNVFSLVSIPEADYRVAMNRSIDAMKVQARRENNVKAEQFLDEMNQRFYEEEVVE